MTVAGIPFQNEPPATATDRARFATLTTDAAREALVRYPLANTLVPQNVAPPDVQWEQGVAGTSTASG